MTGETFKSWKCSCQKGGDLLVPVRLHVVDLQLVPILAVRSRALSPLNDM